MFVEMSLCVTQRPPVDSGQWRRLLTVDGDGGESRGFAEATRSAATRQVGAGVSFFDPTYPAVDGGGMGLGDHGNGATVEAVQAQGGHGGAPFDFPLDQGARGAERFGQSRQPVFDAQEDGVEVFFTVASSRGRECLMAGSPMRARWWRTVRAGTVIWQRSCNSAEMASPEVWPRAMTSTANC